jgi:putative intracellular protease/amidase
MRVAASVLPGGAKSPALLADDARMRAFVRAIDRRGAMVASICRGTLLPVKSEVVRGRRITGFNDAAAYPDLAVAPHAGQSGSMANPSSGMATS